MRESVATESATKQLKHSFTNIPYKQLGKTKLWVSEIGFGSYRINKEDEGHQEALEYALSKGINIIDTSTNYGDGEAEILIGQVINDFIYKQQCQRDQLVIVSKAGYIQGRTWNQVEQRKKQNMPFPEVVELDYGLSHCIHPDFLHEQLCQSLDRLDLSTIDVYLLHNPEYYLIHAQKTGISAEEAHKTYLQRIEQAFDYLEEEVQNGRIKYFGISSNTFPVNESDPTFTPLTPIINFKHPHFAVIQCPLNIFEADGLLVKNQDKKSCLEQAKNANLGTLINRPLNAYHQKQLYCLKDLENMEKRPDKNQLDPLFRQIMTYESQAEEVLKISSIIKEEATQDQLLDIFESGRNIKTYYTSLKGLEESKQYFDHFIIPRLNYAVEALHTTTPLSEEQQQWLGTYIQLLKQIASIIIDDKRYIRCQSLAKIKEVLEQSNKKHKNNSLSQAAVSEIRSHEEVDCVLIGMRQKEYVMDQLKGLEKNKNPKQNKESWKNLN
eukprot:COSAG01_NODE_12293_length_1764_cov_39.807837_1_plen_495_part_10